MGLQGGLHLSTTINKLHNSGPKRGRSCPGRAANWVPPPRETTPSSNRGYCDLPYHQDHQTNSWHELKYIIQQQISQPPFNTSPAHFLQPLSLLNGIIFYLSFFRLILTAFWLYTRKMSLWPKQVSCGEPLVWSLMAYFRGVKQQEYSKNTRQLKSFLKTKYQRQNCCSDAPFLISSSSNIVGADSSQKFPETGSPKRTRCKFGRNLIVINTVAYLQLPFGRKAHKIVQLRIITEINPILGNVNIQDILWHFGIDPLLPLFFGNFDKFPEQAHLRLLVFFQIEIEIHGSSDQTVVIVQSLLCNAYNSGCLIQGVQPLAIPIVGIVQCPPNFD